MNDKPQWGEPGYAPRPGSVARRLEVALGKVGHSYTVLTGCHDRLTRSELVDQLRPHLEQLDPVPPAMLYGHHEETLVALIREQYNLLGHLVELAERRRYFAGPNGSQVVAHQRVRALEVMLDHMGLLPTLGGR